MTCAGCRRPLLHRTGGVVVVQVGEVKLCVACGGWDVRTVEERKGKR